MQENEVMQNYNRFKYSEETLRKANNVVKK